MLTYNEINKTDVANNLENIDIELKLPDINIFSSKMVNLCISATFIAECFELMEGQHNIESSKIIVMCHDWCGENQLLCPSPQIIYAALREFGAVYVKSNGKYFWKGIRELSYDERPWLLGDIEDIRKLLKKPPIMSLTEFCKVTGTGRSSFFAMKDRGTAPAHYKVHGRIKISALAAIEWCQSRSMHAAVMNVADWALDYGERSTRVFNRNRKIWHG
jgi:hypothetical protein